MVTRRHVDDVQLDEVGRWTEIKLEILRKYASAYTQVLRKQSFVKAVAYIDGFAGAGSHISKETGLEIDGSPKIALECDGFTHYHFIDLDGSRTRRLRELAAGRDGVQVHDEGCNKVLLEDILPRYRYKDYRRALCVLDPYALNPAWKVIEAAGKMGSVEIFLNFMIMDANQNVLWKNPEKVRPDQVARMNAFWGDESWRNVAYKQEENLFGTYDAKGSNDDVVEGYRRRLKEVAGFKCVPVPLPMRNSRGAAVYYLFFASHNATGEKIVTQIFNQYRDTDASA